MTEELQKTLRGRSFWIGTVAGLAFIAVFQLWAATDGKSLHHWLREDGPIQNATAIFFGLSSLGFLIFMKRSAYLRENQVYMAVFPFHPFHLLIKRIRVEFL